MPRSVTVFIGLGSNLAQPLLQIKAALTALSKIPQTTFIIDSGYYSSKPMGPQNQPDYLNAVAMLTTSLQALSLLDQLQIIENKQGRVRAQHWGARTLDLDLLLYGDEMIHHPRLTVPHPGILQRDFVFLPLLKLVPSIEIPGCGQLKTLINQPLINNSDKASMNYAATYQGNL